MREQGTTPGNTYEFEVIIKDSNYTNDLTTLNIISSIAAPYPIFEFSLDVDADDIVLEGLFGEDPIKLSLRGIGGDGMIQEELEVELMLLDTNHNMVTKSTLADDKQKNRTGFSFYAVPIDSFKTITTNINEVYTNTDVKTIIQNLVSSNTNAKLEIDSEGINSDFIEQIIIPPTTLYRVIKESGNKGRTDGYIDKQFGLYNGIPSVYCTYDNKIKVMNISKRMKKKTSIIIHQLVEGEDQENTYKKSQEGGTLYTFTPIKTSYSGNTKFSTISKNINHIVKPSDRLFQNIQQDLDDVISKYGTIDKNKKVQKNESLTNRKRYNINHSGNELSEIFANSHVSSLIGNLAKIQLEITGNFLIDELLNIGMSVKFNPSNIEQTDVQGKYILYSTFISFTRKSTEWHKECNLSLVRSNKTN